MRFDALGRALRAGFAMPVARLYDAREIVEHVRNGRYRQHPLSPDALHVPGMISPDERTVLSFLAAHAWCPGTSIVDAGCCLGASTRALIDGLMRAPGLPRRRSRIIHAYDLFQADRYMLDTVLAGSNLKTGDSIESRFVDNLRRDRDLVEIHAGDIRDAEWTGDPIRILFLDIIWSWDINSYVIRNFYRNLADANSFVVHQDYIYAWYPWIPITMEHFSDHFEFVGPVPLATVVFRCVKPLSASDVGIDFLRDASPDRLLSLMARAMERTSGESLGILECSRAQLLRYFGRTDEARSSLLAVIEAFSDFEAPPRFAREMIAHIDSGAAARIV